MDQEKIGCFIAACRKEKNLTQEQIAAQLGVSNRTVSRWETGAGFPDVALLQPLCALLDITVNELLLGERIVPEGDYRTRVEKSTLELIEACRDAAANGQIAAGDNVSSADLDLGWLGLLTVVFVVLKLAGVIDWSWVWVLAPLWIGLLFAAVTVAVALICLRRWWKKREKAGQSPFSQLFARRFPRIKIKFW